MVSDSNAHFFLYYSVDVLYNTSIVQYNMEHAPSPNADASRATYAVGIAHACALEASGRYGGARANKPM